MTYFHYSDCLINKCHKTPFCYILFRLPKNLNLFSQMFGSHQLFLLMVSSIMWYFLSLHALYMVHPIWYKFDVWNIFVKWKTIVENRFQHKLVTFYSENGGEYMAVVDILVSSGVSHLTTPMYNPEHNGFSEQRYRHIVETRLALLSHVGMSVTYLWYEFSIAVYLINRMPNATLSKVNPYRLLFKTLPNYTKLRVFGCLCYPWIRPYQTNKLDARSSTCLFLGYSLTYIAYICFEPSSKWIYISCHVQFVLFPLIFHQCNLLLFIYDWLVSPCISYLDFAACFSVTSLSPRFGSLTTYHTRCCWTVTSDTWGSIWHNTCLVLVSV